jgi:hypothetical protein
MKNPEPLTGNINSFRRARYKVLIGLSSASAPPVRVDFVKPVGKEFEHLGSNRRYPLAMVVWFESTTAVPITMRPLPVVGSIVACSDSQLVPVGSMKFGS